jgi:hypothetical protein
MKGRDLSQVRLLPKTIAAMTIAAIRITAIISPAIQTVKAQCMAFTKMAHKMDKMTARIPIIIIPVRSFT